jgi:hypothetical protein
MRLTHYRRRFPPQRDPHLFHPHRKEPSLSYALASTNPFFAALGVCDYGFYVPGPAPLADGPASSRYGKPACQ